jgi:quinol monooxygenase YgiN
MSQRKVIVAGWITVDPGKRGEVVESFKDMVLRARSAPGCLDFAMTADPVDSDRINMFEFWQSEKDLNSWRTVCKPPKKIARMLRMEVQKHVIQQSGPPFSRRRRKR